MLIVPETWKPPIMTCDATCTQRRRDIERPRKLVGLHTNQHNNSGACALDHAGEPDRPDARIGLIERVDFEFNIIAENSAFRAILCKSVERGERVRGNWRA